MDCRRRPRRPSAQSRYSGQRVRSANVHSRSPAGLTPMSTKEPSCPFMSIVLLLIITVCIEVGVQFLLDVITNVLLSTLLSSRGLQCTLTPHHEIPSITRAK